MRLPLGFVEVIGFGLTGPPNVALARAEKIQADYPEPMGLAADIIGVVVGHALLRCGDLAGAIGRLRESRAGLHGQANAGGFLVFCQLYLTQALAASGDLPAARQALADLEQFSEPTATLLEPDLHLARAALAAREGAVTEALAITGQVAATAAGGGYEILALHAMVRLGDPSPATRLSELASRSSRARLAAAQADALAAGDAERLGGLCEEWLRAGDRLAAADVAAQAAIVLRGQKRDGTAAHWAARADDLARSCGGAWSPVLAAAARPLALSAREREVVTLAAHGLANRAIADRLGLSVRTVEGHLYRIRRKLGANDRTGLAALIGEG